MPEATEAVAPVDATATPAPDAGAEPELTLEEITAAVFKSRAAPEDTEQDASDAEADPDAAKTEAKSPEEQSKLDRAAAAAAKARAASSRNKQLRLQGQQLQAAQRRAEQEAAQLRAQNQQAIEFQKLLAQDPYAAMKKLGMTERAIVERVLKDGSPESQLQQVQRQLEAERQERLRFEESLHREKQTIVLQQAQNAFLSRASDDKSYPNLSEVPPSLVLASVKQLQRDMIESGRERQFSSSTDDEICEYLETTLARHKQSRAKTPAAKSEEVVETKKGASKTLTNRLSSSKYTVPPNFDDLPDDEKMQHLTKMAASMRTAS